MASLNSAQRLTVAIAAHAGPGGTGGVARFMGSLIEALGKLDGPEKYLIVVKSDAHRAWLEPLLGRNQQIVFESTQPVQGKSAIGLLKAMLGPLLPAARGLQRVINIPAVWPEVPISDGFYEALGCDVLHIPNQTFFLSAVPTVYNPHDLQHLHYPQFFSPKIIAWRETIFPAGCHFAHTVVVGSQWVKEDVIQRYRVDPGKVQVIFEAPTTEAKVTLTPERLSAVRAKYQIDAPFAFYPAMTWQHKNHIRLLEALAQLRAEGLIVPLICTGSRQNDFWQKIAASIDTLQLSPQVRFLDLVPDEDLKALFSMAQFMVFPTLLEAISLPIFEAWLAGLPVACSNVTALPEQVRDAALLFDPRSSKAIASAVRRMATEAGLRRDLQSRGKRRIEDFTWERTAKAYRAVYRRAAGADLTEEDVWLLSWDWTTPFASAADADLRSRSAE